MPCSELPEISAWRCKWERMRHAEATLEFLQRPGFPVQLPAGQNLRSLKGPVSFAPMIKGTWTPALPWVSEIGAHCKPGQGVCQGVFIPRVCSFPCLLWLFFIGLILCNRWKLQHTWPPPYPYPNWLQSYWGLYLPRPLPGTVLFPLAEMRHPGPGEGKTSFPTFLTQTVSTQCLWFGDLALIVSG